MPSYTHLEQLVYLHVYVLLMDDEEVKGQCFSDWIIHLGCNQMMMDKLPFLEYQMLKQHAMINLFYLYHSSVVYLRSLSLFSCNDDAGTASEKTNPSKVGRKRAIRSSTKSCSSPSSPWFSRFDSNRKVFIAKS